MRGRDGAGDPGREPGGAPRGSAAESGTRRLIHGADYCPEQWLGSPEVLEEDVWLMRQAGLTAVTVGNFAWSALEPEEGRFTFEWLDRTMDAMQGAGISVILATPTGSRPPWMSRRYPEVLRTEADRRRNLHGGRHNHCPTSPVYRDKARTINRRLAERYGRHPALILWHLSNEYGGECHCPLCQEAFRGWLRSRYGDELAKLNLAWWTAFWSHTFTGWEQIESPTPHGEMYLPGLALDWKRFVTDQTVDFLLAEAGPLRELTPEVPLTTNLMGTYPGLDYARLAPHLDIVSWDSYPCWHGRPEDGGGPFLSDPLGRDWIVAAGTAFSHDLMRSLKAGKPFLLMESTPSVSNWHAVRKLKRPGMHVASSLLAVAHGSDSVQYFQWRRSRGGFEKFHGAVLGHRGAERTRTFREVAEVGRVLAGLQGVAGSTVSAETAILYDWENRWAVEGARLAPADGSAGYLGSCLQHHYPYWALGVPTDVIGMDRDFSPYRLLVAPLLAMVKEGVGERMERFVSDGGTVVLTQGSGTVDESDLCFPGCRPGPLRRLLGLWVEETDELYPGEGNRLLVQEGNPLGLTGTYGISDRCDILHPEGATVLGLYGADFYAGTPALTMHELGRGRAFYLAAGFDDAFLKDFAGAVVAFLGLRRAIEAELPEGVTAQVRRDGTGEYVFLLSFSAQPKTVDIGDARDALTGERLPRSVRLPGYGWQVVKRPAAAPQAG
jgi:beta-galactosidase